MKEVNLLFPMVLWRKFPYSCSSSRGHCEINLTSSQVLRVLWEYPHGPITFGMRFGTSSRNVHVLMFPKSVLEGGFGLHIYLLSLGPFPRARETTFWSMTLTSYNALIFIKEIGTVNCICKYFQVHVNFFFCILPIVFQGFMNEYVWYYWLFVPFFPNICVSWYWDQEQLSWYIFFARYVWPKYQP